MSLPTSARKPPASEGGSSGSACTAPAIKADHRAGPGEIASAYDRLAPGYDASLAPSQWIRARLWARMDALFPPGSRLLDVTAGTGLDALHLARRGVKVIACDLSAGMLALLHRKGPDIPVVVADFGSLGFGNWDLGFDGALSTFAGLNTSADLRPFASGAARLLRPGGALFLHLLNRWPLLDIAGQFARLRWRDGWRAATSARREVNLGGSLILHTLYSPLSLYRQVFAPWFHLRLISGQALVRPVDEGWGKSLDGLDRWLGARFPFRSFGTFFLLELIRR